MEVNVNYWHNAGCLKNLHFRRESIFLHIILRVTRLSGSRVYRSNPPVCSLH